MKLKKILMVSAIVAGGVFLLGGAGMMKSKWSELKQAFRGWVDENTSPEAEIARLKGQVAELDAEENSIKNDLAKEIAAYDKLDKQVKTLRTAVESERKDVLAFADQITDAEENKKKVSVGKVSMEVDQAKRKLVADKNAVKGKETNLASLEKNLQTRDENKKILFDQLAEISVLRTELTTELDALDAEYKALKLEGMKNRNHKGNDKLGEIRADIEKLKDKAAERRARINLDGAKVKAEAPVTESAQDIVAELRGK